MLPWSNGRAAESCRGQSHNLAGSLQGLDQDPSGREIGSGHIGTELLGGAGRIVDQMGQRGAKLTDIVRRDAGRHSDGNARRAIGEQVRKAGGKDDGLAVLAVIG